MAERTAIFNLKINDGNSAKKVARNEKELEKYRKSVQSADKTSKDFSKQLQAVNKVVDSNAFSMREANKLIQDYQTIAIRAGKDSPVGREAIQRAAELTDRMGKLRNEVRNLSQDGQALQGALAISSATLGGYQAFQGVSAMLGVENEQLMQTMVKLQAVKQVSIGLEQVRKQLEEGSAARMALLTMRAKAITAATWLYSQSKAALTLSIGGATGAMKLFRLALIATGIGAFVVLLGSLISNWDKVTETVKGAASAIREFIDDSVVLSTILKALLAPINALIKALEWLGIIEDEATKQARRAAKERAKAIQKQREEERQRIKDKIEGLKEEQKAVDEQIDFEIRKRRALGKETTDLERQRMQAVIASSQEQIKAINELISAYMEEVKIKMLTGQFAIEEQNKIAKLIEEREKLSAAIRNTNKDLEVFDIQQRRAQQQRAEDAANKELEEEERKAQEKLKLQQHFEDMIIASIEDEGLRKREALALQHERERQQLIEKYGEDEELLKALERNQHEQLMALQEELREEESKVNKEREEQLREEELLRLENDLMEMELDFYERLDREMELERLRTEMLLDNDELTAEERRRIELELSDKLQEIRNKEIEHEQDAAEAINSARQSILANSIAAVGEYGRLAGENEQIMKAAALADIAAQTASGFVRGLQIAQQGAAAAGPAAPFAFPAFFAAQTAAVLSAANQARSILGAGGSASAPATPSTPSMGGREEQQARNTRTEQQGQLTSKVVVTETDITRTQQKVQDIEVRAVF